MAQLLLIIFGLILVFIGLLIVFSIIGISSSKSDVKSVGVILIGPFPILVKGKGFKTLLILFLFIIVIVFSLFIFLGAF